MTGLSANGESASFPCYVYDLDSNSFDAAGSSSEPSAGLAGIESYSKDYEQRVDVAEHIVWVAATRMLAQRLADC